PLTSYHTCSFPFCLSHRHLHSFPTRRSSDLSLWAHSYPREDPAYAVRPIDFVPTNVAFAPNGDFFVGDGYGSHHVLRFSSDGKRSEEHTSELQSPYDLVCRLLLEKKKKKSS